jgi:uncharacterized protein YbaR (Trm112 family)
MGVKKQHKGPLAPELYSILACPMCKADIKYSTDYRWLVCTKCKRKYPIKNGIPVLLPK